MNTEFEERVLEIDKEEIVKKLEKLKAVKVGDFKQRRYVYDFHPKRPSEWIRLRTNGTKTTLTYKNVEKDTIDGTKELEIEVSSFDKTNEMLEILGYKRRAYQENERTRYILDDVEIDIDSWPLIPPYLEIEADSIEKVKEIEKKLKIDEELVTYLNCDDIYKKVYNINVDEIEELKF